MLRDLDFTQSLDLRDFIIKELISNNRNTMIFSAKNQKTNKDVAIKIIQINKENKIKHYQKITYIKSFNFQGVVKLLNFRYYDSDIIQYFNPQYFFSNMENCSYFVGELEWMKNKTLKHLISESDQIDPTIISKIIFGIAYTMKSIHKANLIYGYLTPSNILLDENFEPKLVFSYYSKFLEKEKKRKRNHHLFGHNFYAPEIVEVKIDCFVDVYSFGMILYDIFNKIDTKAVFEMYERNGSFEQRNTPDKYWEIVNKCLKDNKDLRPTFSEIVESLIKVELTHEENNVKTDLAQVHEYILRFEKGEMATIADKFSLLMSKYI